ncbi:MAG: hypothetical protein SNJ79_08865, partial [Sphingomonadaceae bacterium]
MHRVHAGLAGLGLVFIVTLLGSLALQPSEDGFGREDRNDPLAQLGVAPSPGVDRKEPERRAPQPEEQPIVDRVA